MSNVVSNVRSTLIGVRNPPKNCDQFIAHDPSIHGR